MEKYILAHDLGTTGDKATLVDIDGYMKATAFQGYATHYPNNGWAEQDAWDYWKAFCKANKRLFEISDVTPDEVAAVSFSGQMMAALPVDSEGNPLRRSIIWADLRSESQAERVLKKISPDRAYKITGHRLSASYSASKILWIKENEPGIYKRTYKFIHAKDFIVLRLTGKFVTDYSDASGMNLLDINKMEWSEEMLKATGIDREKLPDITESVTVVGVVKKEVSRESGLLSGTPVVIGGGDGACATAGAGVVEKGQSYIYLGTSTWMGIIDTKPILDPKKRTFTFCHFKKNLYFAAGTMQTGGGSYGWFKNVFCDYESEKAKISNQDVYEILNSKASKIKPGAEGLIFLPYLMGERSPLWDPKARGAFIGLTLRHSKEHMIRAVLEGVAFNMKIIVEAFKEQGAETDLIRMIGGGAKSRLWRSIFSDIIGINVAKLNLIEEATSCGAAIAGGVGVGIFNSIEDAAKIVKITDIVKPDSKNRELYEKYYELFKESYNRLKDIFYGIAGLEQLERSI